MTKESIILVYAIKSLNDDIYIYICESRNTYKCLIDVQLALFDHQIRRDKFYHERKHEQPGLLKRHILFSNAPSLRKPSMHGIVIPKSAAMRGIRGGVINCN